jgi:hypothetical protein
VAKGLAVAEARALTPVAVAVETQARLPEVAPVD